jgi:hypothetical protein
MSGYRTSEEAKQEYISKMGKALGETFHALWQEVAWLFSKWNEYVTLFGTKPSRIDILNNAAPFFFRIIQDVLWEEIILHVARLTDPPKSVGKSNLTIQQLPGLVSDTTVSKEISNLVNTTVQKVDFCRDWRNRRIAHSDLKLAIEKGINPLQPASRKKVRAVLDSIVEVLNAVSRHYTDSTNFFDNTDPPDGAMSLLYVLDDGLQAGKEKRDRLNRGEYQESDNHPREL